MIRPVFLILPFLFICSRVDVHVPSQNERSMRVAIVHSYSKDFYWTNEVENGFLNTLMEQFEIQIVSKDYLDAKSDPDGVKARAEKIYSKLKSSSFDLLFITDDDAFFLVGKHYFNTKTKVVVAGINSPLLEFGKSESEVIRNLPKNVSGVLERYSIFPLVQFIRDILPQKKNLILLFDKSKTSNGVYDNLILEISSAKSIGGLKIKSIIRSDNLSIWKNTMQKANFQDVILIFPFSNIKRNSPNLKKIDDFASWLVKQSSVPEFATASLFNNNNFFATV